MKNCPYCAEKVKDEAVVCRFCKSNLDSDKKLKAKDHESYYAFTLLCAILPFVGILVGAIYLTKDRKVDKSLGEHCIAFSILFGILWGAVISLLYSPLLII